jgi:hypothetical protein
MRSGGTASLSGWQPGDPTPEQISEITADIRRGCSHREHYVRAGKRPPVWLAPHDLHVDAWTAPVMSMGDGVGEPAA